MHQHGQHPLSNNQGSKSVSNIAGGVTGNTFMMGSAAEILNSSNKAGSNSYGLRPESGKKRASFLLNGQPTSNSYHSQSQAVLNNHHASTHNDQSGILTNKTNVDPSYNSVSCCTGGYRWRSSLGRRREGLWLLLLQRCLWEYTFRR